MSFTLSEVQVNMKHTTREMLFLTVQHLTEKTFKYLYFKRNCGEGKHYWQTILKVVTGSQDNFIVDTSF